MSTTVDLIINIRCSYCDEALESELVLEDEQAYISVGECPTCREDAEEAAREEGKTEGYDEGREEGYDEGYRDGKEDSEDG